MPKKNNTRVISVPKASDDRILVRVVIWLLALFAVIQFSRLFLPGEPFLAGGDSVWQVSFTGNVAMTHEGGDIHIAPLQNTAYVRVIGQHIYHPQMRQKRTGKKGRSQDIILTSNQPGTKHFQVSFDIHLSHQPQPQLTKPMAEDRREQWLKPGAGIFIDAPGTVELLSTAIDIESEAHDKARFLFDHVSEKISIVESGSDDGGVALQLRSGSRLGAVRALVSLLRSAHLPARTVTGIDLLASSAEQPHYWLETYYQGQWHAMDIARGNFNQLPRELIPVARNSVDIARFKAKDAIPLTITTKPNPDSQYAQPENRGEVTQIFNLMRISPGGREALALLILLPIGVLVTEFFRQFVGLRTFGTFTPSLLALAAVYTELKTALIVFSLVIIVGVAGRALLPKINLSRVPRLSIVFTMVASIMVFAVSGLLYFDPNIDTAVVLLPIVVLTSLVDRFYSVADDIGLMSALKRLFWTVATAAISMLILLQDMAGYWLLQYPETHLLTIVFIILFGRYRGRRLVENNSLRWIAESTSSNRKTNDPEAEI